MKLKRELCTTSVLYPVRTADACVRAAVDVLFAVQEDRPKPTIKEIRKILSKIGVSFRTSEIARVLREEFPRERSLKSSAPVAGSGWQWGGVWHQSPGVYALRQDGQVVYIGSSSNIANRLSSHELLRTLKQQGEIEVGIRYISKPGEHLAAEYRLIRRLQPKLNVAGRA